MTPNVSMQWDCSGKQFVTGMFGCYCTSLNFLTAITIEAVQWQSKFQTIIRWHRWIWLIFIHIWPDWMGSSFDKPKCFNRLKANNGNAGRVIILGLQDNTIYPLTLCS